MADPEGYDPQYDFSAYQATNPNRPLPGHELDVELQNISEAIGQTQTALSDIRRPDGQLQNGIVTLESAAEGFVEGIIGLAEGALSAIDGYGEELTFFSQVWLGAQSSDPVTGLADNPLFAGQMYYNTVANEYRVYNGSAWQFHTGLTQMDSYIWSATSGQTVFSGVDGGGKVVSLTTGALLVYAAGTGPLREGVDYDVLTGGDGIEFVTGRTAGDKVQIVSFRQLNITNIAPQVASDADRAEAAVTQAEAAADAATASALAIGGRFFASEAAFDASTIDPLVDTVFILYGNELVGFKRTPGASGPDDISHPNGSDWAKATLTNADLIAAVTDIITAGEFPTYAEGAFTPVFTWSDFAAGSVSGGATSGSFVREGRMVYIDASFVGITVARATDSGTIRIGNLPYPAAANTFGCLHIRRCSGIDLRDTGSAPPMNATVAVVAGQTYGTLTINPANAATFSAGVARCAAGAGAVTLQVTGWYEVQD